MGSLIVVTGPPGAGKSTVSNLLAQRSDPSVLIEGDAFFAFLANGAVEPWLAESDDQNAVVTSAAAAAAGAFTRGPYTTVYDGVLGPWFLPTFAAGSGLERFDYVVLMPPVEVCVERVLNRLDHGFRDESATRKMHAEFAASEIPGRHLIVDGLADPQAVVDVIATRRDAGGLEYTAS